MGYAFLVVTATFVEFPIGGIRSHPFVVILFLIGQGVREFIFATDFRWFLRIRAKINENLQEKGMITYIFARKRENQL